MSGRFSGICPGHAHREGASYALGADETVNSFGRKLEGRAQGPLPRRVRQDHRHGAPCGDLLIIWVFWPSAGDLIYNGISLY